MDSLETEQAIADAWDEGYAFGKEEIATRLIHELSDMVIRLREQYT